MDRPITHKTALRRKHLPFIAAGIGVLALVAWIVLGNHDSAVSVDASQLTISTVTRGQFNDYVRLNGQVAPIQVVQISPEEGGIVREKVVEEGAMVHRGDVILRLSNSDLDLQILNAEAELAEKQNLLRNTQIAMQQDNLNNETERATLDMGVERGKRAYQQNKRLYDDHLVSREAYEQSREDYELACRKQALIRKRIGLSLIHI